MTQKEMLRKIAFEIPLFQDIEQKEIFLFVLGALVSRVISLQKAAEIMQMDSSVFLQILNLIGINFSYLEAEDVSIEKNWKREDENCF